MLGKKGHSFRRNRAVQLGQLMESLNFSDLDRGLLHALDIDARAPFARLASVLGVSAHTVARRYQRLLAAGITVTGTIEPQRVGLTSWLARIRTAPHASSAVATALARRDDTAWISLVSGGTEIVCGINTSSDSHRDQLLLGTLPRTASIDSVFAHYVLHEFTTPETAKAWLGALSDEQITELRPIPVEQDHDPIALTRTDQAVLDLLARNGRATHTALAAATGASESAIRRRIGELRAAGVLTIGPTIDPAQLGHGISAHLWLRVAPDELPHIGDALASHPGVPFAAATTGTSNLTATIWCTDTHSLYRYLTEGIGRFPGVDHIETAPVVRPVKRT